MLASPQMLTRNAYKPSATDSVGIDARFDSRRSGVQTMNTANCRNSITIGSLNPKCSNIALFIRFAISADAP
jgi:hypothetical protein